MKLTKQRIRSLKSNVGFIKEGTKVMLGVEGISRFEDILQKVGFSHNWKVGNSVLPASIFGPVSEFNAHGKHKRHKDRPMETAYRTIEWRWEEWNGPYDTIPRSRLVDVPYKRYPRTFIEPPSIELAIFKTAKGASVLVGPVMEYRNDSPIFLHTVNLFLEIFGECQFFTESISEIIRAPVRKLNWRVLPKGCRPWSKLKGELNAVLKAVPRGNKPVVEHRIEAINKYKPDFVAVGRAGFWGYVILGFEKKNLFILESPFYGNAVYIFGEDWKELSKKTKAEILREHSQIDRIIHREGWERKLKILLKKRIV